jgi:hypothetical protein
MTHNATHDASNAQPLRENVNRRRRNRMKPSHGKDHADRANVVVSVPADAVADDAHDLRENLKKTTDLRDDLLRQRAEKEHERARARAQERTRPQPKSGEASHQTPRAKTQNKKGRNTQDFSPSLAPPGLKLVVGDAAAKTLGRKMHGRHVTYVPNFFCAEADESAHATLLEEVSAAGSSEMWIPWHEKSHFIANDRDRHGKWKQDSPMFTAVVEKIAAYFQMDVKATRFNLYRDEEEWKPYHHDAAAVKKDKARTQNCTIAVSFGATRDVAFEHAKTGTTVFLPQTNGSCYAFGHDVNVEWRHGVPQVPEGLRRAEGGKCARVSIIAWGWVDQDRDDVSSFAN